MRLHALSLTAFGPFPGTVDLDLDDVARDGLFLLWGPTGAGKTTLLDAVVFALYGTVPGVRGHDKRLRGRGDLEIAEEFVAHVRGLAASPSERELLARALGAADRTEAAR